MLTHLLQPNRHARLHETLDRINADVKVPCASVPGGEERVQLAAALVHKLRRTGYDVLEEAEGFARALHNECACVDADGGGGESVVGPLNVAHGI